MLSYDPPVSVNGQIPATKIASMTLNNLGPDPAPKKTTMTPINPSSNKIAKTNGQPGPAYHHIWLVTGPAGCGKTTVATHLANSLNVPYVEGDEFHPPANIDKMAAGIPLTDADRWDWLTVLREQALQRLSGGADGVVVTCSALKRQYRDVIRVAPSYTHDVLRHFIYLHAPEEVLLERVGARQGHYMGANMVHSQFSILEPPTAEEKDVISIDVSKPMDAVVAEALDKVLHTVDETTR